MATKRDVAIATLAGFGAIQVFPVLISPINEIPKMVQQDPDALSEIRRGEVISAAIALLAGWAASATANSPLPLIFTVGAVMLMLVAYEDALKRGVMAT